MKNIVFLLFSVVVYRAQVLPLNTKIDNIPNGAYLKDLNNDLEPYVGIYRVVFEGKEITLYIRKQERVYFDGLDVDYYQDILDIKYTVKSSSGVILQDIYTSNPMGIKFYSMGTIPHKNSLALSYSGGACGIGEGVIFIKKINATQFTWDYILMSARTEGCPSGTDLKVYLPVARGLIFTKQ